MGLMFYSISLLTLVAGTVLYVTRAYWVHHIPIPERFIHYAPIPQNFREDVEAGLHSADFDMTGNVEGDSRSGLDETAKKEVLRIMKRRGVGFDEARRIFMEQNFKKSGIGKDGLPRDPKLVTFS
ncbi:hypothetical protein BLS_004292 [Venturia inaequalis]|uniref:Uncharacterized protein n=1 Tax=Venturia inaequalis TaxID=5025 RepID=A0A8H3VAP4_VENIN|nr:hypothetical protein BLS_004292 [Venturia inaequalis]KAE9985327.1 hypothetical protein EG328_007580 [Venturia inaequalis]KAE9986417.1 hypothetical protein EG327_004306 [Venturia inaequalis]RDI86442.1 Imidazoleglycerol-phosphate dehydratase [Venturia inaequalis]